MSGLVRTAGVRAEHNNLREKEGGGRQWDPELEDVKMVPFKGAGQWRPALLLENSGAVGSTSYNVDSLYNMYWG